VICPSVPFSDSSRSLDADMRTARVFVSNAFERGSTVGYAQIQIALPRHNLLLSPCCWVFILSRWNFPPNWSWSTDYARHIECPDYWQTDNSNGLVMAIRNYHWLNSASWVLMSHKWFKLERVNKHTNGRMGTTKRIFSYALRLIIRDGARWGWKIFLWQQYTIFHCLTLTFD